MNPIPLEIIIIIESDGATDCNWCNPNTTQRLGKGTERFRNQRMSRDHPYYNIVKISKNTEESSGDLKKLAVAQTQVKDHQLAFI